MFMANMAPGSPSHVSGGYPGPDDDWPFAPLLNPWIEADAAFGGGPLLWLSFELAPSGPAMAPSLRGTATTMPDANDSARHKAQVAALPVYLAASETAFPSLANTAEAPPGQEASPWDQVLWNLVADPAATPGTRFPPSGAPHPQILVAEPGPWTEGMMVGVHRLAPPASGWLML